jgi:hypothetical protein
VFQKPDSLRVMTMSSQPKPNSARTLTDTRTIIKQKQQAWAATPRTFTSCQVSKGRLHPCQLSDLRNTNRNKSSPRRLWEVQHMTKPTAAHRVTAIEQSGLKNTRHLKRNEAVVCERKRMRTQERIYPRPEQAATRWRSPVLR